MGKLESTRNSNIELFRLVLMVMVVLHHSIIYGLGLGSLNNTNGVSLVVPDNEIPLYLSINTFLVVAVNSFVLVSGYFGIRPTFKKYKSLFLTVAFYTLLFTTTYHLYHNEVKNTISSVMLLSHNRYYFIINYMLLMAFSPMINWFYDIADSRKKTLFTTAMLVGTCYVGFMFQNYSLNDTGYSLFQFITMYVLGRHLRNINSSLLTSKWMILLFIGICSLNASLIVACFNRGYTELAYHLNHYNSPLIVLASVFIFCFFLSLSIKSTLINKVAESALAIYLFQESTLIRNILFEGVSCCYRDNCVVGGNLDSYDNYNCHHC